MLPNESPLRRFLFPNRCPEATEHTFLPPCRQTSSLENKNAISQKKGERQQKPPVLPKLKENNVSTSEQIILTYRADKHIVILLTLDVGQFVRYYL